MSRRNFKVADDIVHAFQVLRGEDDVRGFQLEIHGKCLVLKRILRKVHDDSQDFNFLRKVLIRTEASIVVFRKAFGTPCWSLLCWLPGPCSVRDKMIYSSSRDDVKNIFGKEYFVDGSDYTANSEIDIDFHTYNLSCSDRSAPKDSEFRSAEEILSSDEKMSSVKRNSVTESLAVGVLPLVINEELLMSLRQFKNTACMMIEMKLDGERMIISRTESIFNWGNYHEVMSRLPRVEARFILFRVGTNCNEAPNSYKSHIYFILYCPECCPVDIKMTMSSLKATLFRLVNGLGIHVTESVEICLYEDVFSFLLYVEQCENNLVSCTSFSSVGSALLVHSRPMRPGRKSKTSRKKFSNTITKS